MAVTFLGQVHSPLVGLLCDALYHDEKFEAQTTLKNYSKTAMCLLK